MANFKRRRSKNRRAGCLFCKYWKHTSHKDSFHHQTRQEKRARISEEEQRKETRE